MLMTWLRNAFSLLLRKPLLKSNDVVIPGFCSVLKSISMFLTGNEAQFPMKYYFIKALQLHYLRRVEKSTSSSVDNLSVFVR